MEVELESKVTVGFIRDVIYFAVSRGVSLTVFCEAVGISPDLLSKPDEKVAGHLSQKVWQKAEEYTGDADIGLHLGEQNHPSMLGLVGFVMLSCANLGEALEKLIRYTNLLTDALQGKIVKKGLLAEIELEIIRDRPNYLLESPRQPIECSLSAIATIAEILTGKDFPIREMHFRHQRPTDISEHKRIFSAPILFSQPSDKIIFAAEALKYPILLANSDLLSTFEAQAEQSLNRLNKQETRTIQVQQKIVKRLNAELPNITDVARELGLSERSLQRELAAENTSFRELLDETRRELAIKHLQNKKVSVAEISFLLGFSEPSAFHRFFKRQTGKTPNAFRESAEN